MLSSVESARLTELRQDLHRHPELSGQEAGTAGRITAFLRSLAVDGVVQHLGGHGVAAVIEGRTAGPTVLVRADMDAVAVQEAAATGHRSQTPGVSHACGHDGHMAVLSGLAVHLARRRPVRGRVVLLFQPAEENGRGAAAVLQDRRFEELRPELAFAMHNFPGHGHGHVLVRTGTMTCASRGMQVTLQGVPAHAAQPEAGKSPALALSRLIGEFSRLPETLELPGDEIAFATVVFARLGERAFGVAPSRGEVMATLRSEHNRTMGRMVRRMRDVLQAEADAAGLTFDTAWHDVFPATVNSPAAVAMVRDAARRRGLAVLDLATPMRASEDFGRFGALCPIALFGLGSGRSAAPLHSAEYDFPDSLIGPAVSLLTAVVDRALKCEREQAGQ